MNILYIGGRTNDVTRWYHVILRFQHVPCDGSRPEVKFVDVYINRVVRSHFRLRAPSPRLYFTRRRIKKPVRLVIFLSALPSQPYRLLRLTQCVEFSAFSCTTLPSTLHQRYVRVCRCCSIADKMHAGSSRAGLGVGCISARRMGWSATCSRRRRLCG